MYFYYQLNKMMIIPISSQGASIRLKVENVKWHTVGLFSVNAQTQLSSEMELLDLTSGGHKEEGIT